jgi:SAM-dependent methyltransferase
MIPRLLNRAGPNAPAAAALSQKSLPPRPKVPRTLPKTASPRNAGNIPENRALGGGERSTTAVNPPGCGTGRNLILAARKYPTARFFGVDVSTEMLTSAIGAIERAGLASRIRVAHADATRSVPTALFGKARFERVFISYSLSMMPAWVGGPG